MITTVDKYTEQITNQKNKKHTDMEKPSPRGEIKLSNKYEILSSIEDSDSDSENESTKNAMKKDKTNKTKKIEKLPPLVIHGKVNENTLFINTIKEKLEAEFHIKYHQDTTEVFTTTVSDYEKLKTHWQESDVKFHTYTEKRNKKKVFVVKGLHDQTNVDEMKKEMNEMGLEAEKINKMRGTTRPMFMVTVPMYKNLGEVQRSIKYLQYTKVQWDKYITKKKVTQCHRCQAWGHATSNCFAEPSCLKCAGQHLTYECTKTKDTPAKCVNCKGDHPANAIICPVYIERTQKQQMQNTNKNAKQIYNNGKTMQIENVREFPPLTKAYSKPTTTNQWRKMGEAQNSHEYNYATTTTTTSNRNKKDTGTEPGINELLTITDTIREINKMCDIQKMLNLILQLKHNLSTCTTNTQKFQVMLEFTNKLDEK